MSRWQFGEASLAVLATVHQGLVVIAEEALARSPWDFMVREGRRNEAEQNAAVAAGLSTKPWPTSAHNTTPPALSRAVHFIPYPIDWEQKPPLDCYLLAGVVMAAAMECRIPLVWGGRWKRPHDPCHYELFRTVGDTLPVYGGE